MRWCFPITARRSFAYISIILIMRASRPPPAPGSALNLLLFYPCLIPSPSVSVCLHSSTSPDIGALKSAFKRSYNTVSACSLLHGKAPSYYLQTSFQPIFFISSLPLLPFAFVCRKFVTVHRTCSHFISSALI